MVKNRQSAIPELAFAPPVGTPAGMEVMTLSRLRARISRHRLAFPQRPAFHQLITVTRALSPTWQGTSGAGGAAFGRGGHLKRARSSMYRRVPAEKNHTITAAEKARTWVMSSLPTIPVLENEQ
ncbi:hypothetical protein SAMN05444920_109277 [Nonomuraea solani]|uniref:Uncharacterized protein n=1 Tax=Nonomuraea solani TaxID=1144553 RepID=A0A1H6EFP7_9ACTN|nr:hypothetical protein SAMN05444920_109277 [Nonomuraea solani]